MLDDEGGAVMTFVSSSAGVKTGLLASLSCFFTCLSLPTGLFIKLRTIELLLLESWAAAAGLYPDLLIFNTVFDTYNCL